MSEATVWGETQALARAIYSAVRVDARADGAGFEGRWRVDWDAVPAAGDEALRAATSDDVRLSLSDETVLRLISDVMDGVTRCDVDMSGEDDVLTLADMVWAWFEDDGWQPPVDVYTGDLFAWAARFYDEVEDVLHEVGWTPGVSTLFDVITSAQAQWMESLARVLVYHVLQAGAEVTP